MKTVSLKCSNCGGNLEVRPDVTELACGYCGATLTVERGGGAITLHQIKDEISHVRRGTDKAVAELAISRLERDLSALSQKWNERQAQAKTQKSQTSILLCVVMLVGWGVAALLSMSTVEGAVYCALFVTVGIAILWPILAISVSNKMNSEGQRIAKEQKAIQKRIAEQRDLVDA